MLFNTVIIDIKEVYEVLANKLLQRLDKFTLKHYFRIQKVIEQYGFPYTMTERTKKEPNTYEITTFAIQDWPWPLQQPHHGA